MRIAIAREAGAGEARVAATPETVKRIKNLGADVVVQAGAGTASGMLDGEYEAAGATIAATIQDAVKDAEAVFIAVGTPSRPADGLADLSYVYQAAREIAHALRGYAVIVTKSTVPVGTGTTPCSRANALGRSSQRSTPRTSASTATRARNSSWSS